VVEQRFDKKFCVSTRSGKVYTISADGQRRKLLLDISDEVATFGDHGMLGMALSPNFEINGWIYLHYVVDTRFSTPPTFSRITRYTATEATGFEQIDYASRKVLVGTDGMDGIPAFTNYHSCGALVFGRDGTLMAMHGDAGPPAASLGHTDESRTTAAKSLSNAQERSIGSLRAQAIDSMDGKMLRFNAATGDGVSSNPFFDPERPRAERSRVWALGFRNPWRARLLEEPTFSEEYPEHPLPEQGKPGRFAVGDVGWTAVEEMTIVDGAGFNGGWPKFEGMSDSPRSLHVDGADKTNTRARNCKFYELLLDDARELPLELACTGEKINWVNRNYGWAGDVPVFRHARPALDYMHYSTRARYPSYWPVRGTAATCTVLNEDRGCTHPDSMPYLSGYSVTGGPSIGVGKGDTWPKEWSGVFFSDYVSKWLYVANVGKTADGLYQMSNARKFNGVPSAVNIVDIARTIDGDGLIIVGLYGMDITVVQWDPTGGRNSAPKARVTPAQEAGTSPLKVTLDASASSDPDDGDLLRFAFDWGDGSSTESNHPFATHTYVAAKPQKFTAVVTVTDSAGASSSAEMVVVVNNGAPTATITSPAHNSRYPLEQQYATVTLDAEVGDPDGDELSCEWEMRLQHNTHYHTIDYFPGCTRTEARFEAFGCFPDEGESYWYKFILTVKDAPFDLVTTAQVLIWPDCATDADIALLGNL